MIAKLRRTPEVSAKVTPRWGSGGEDQGGLELPQDKEAARCQEDWRHPTSDRCRLTRCRDTGFDWRSRALTTRWTLTCSRGWPAAARGHYPKTKSAWAMEAPPWHRAAMAPTIPCSSQGAGRPEIQGKRLAHGLLDSTMWIKAMRLDGAQEPGTTASRSDGVTEQ